MTPCPLGVKIALTVMVAAMPLYGVGSLTNRERLYDAGLTLLLVGAFGLMISLLSFLWTSA